MRAMVHRHRAKTRQAVIDGRIVKRNKYDMTKAKYGSLSVMVSQLETAIAYHEREKASILSDPQLAQYRDDLRTQKTHARLEALQAYSKDGIAKLVTGIWGDGSDLSQPLVGGAVWQELEASKEALRRSKTDAGDRYDWGHVTAAASRAKSKLDGFGNVREASDYFDAAGDYDRLGMSDAISAYSGRLRGESGFGALVSHIEASRAALFMSPAVVSAQKRVEQAQDDAAHAWDASHAAVKALGMVSVFDQGPARVLRRIHAEQHYDSQAETFEMTFQKREPLMAIVGDAIKNDGKPGIDLA